MYDLAKQKHLDTNKCFASISITPYFSTVYRIVNSNLRNGTCKQVKTRTSKGLWRTRPVAHGSRRRRRVAC